MILNGEQVEIGEDEPSEASDVQPFATQKSLNNSETGMARGGDYLTELVDHNFAEIV